RLRDGLGHAHDVLLGQAVHVAEVRRVTLHHAHRSAALAAGLRALELRVVEAESKAVPILRVDLAEVAAMPERTLEGAAGEFFADQRHSSSGTSATCISSGPTISTIARAVSTSATPASEDASSVRGRPPSSYSRILGVRAAWRRLTPAITDSASSVARPI